MHGRPLKATVQSVQYALLPVTSLVAISNNLKFFPNKKRCRQAPHSGKRTIARPLLGPNPGPVAVVGSELVLLRSCWSHGGDRIKVLASGFCAVLTDGDQRPGSVPGPPDCGL